MCKKKVPVVTRELFESFLLTSKICNICRGVVHHKSVVIQMEWRFALGASLGVLHGI